MYTSRQLGVFMLVELHLKSHSRSERSLCYLTDMRVFGDTWPSAETAKLNSSPQQPDREVWVTVMGLIDPASWPGAPAHERAGGLQ